MLESILGKQSPIINIGFVVVALILFQPINNQIDNIIKRWFIRDKSDYRNIINSLSSQIINILDRAQLFKLVEDTLRTSMQVRGVGFDGPEIRSLVDFDLNAFRQGPFQHLLHGQQGKTCVCRRRLP